MGVKQPLVGASVGILAACLLAASANKASAQLCRCAEPGWMYCDLLGHHSHEPATAAFPQCLARAPRAAPPQRQPATRSKPEPETEEGETEPNPSKFEPTTSHQIRPLPCPRAAPFQVGETFYGGARCATADQARALVQQARNAFEQALQQGAQGVPSEQAKQTPTQPEAKEPPQQSPEEKPTPLLRNTDSTAPAPKNKPVICDPLQIGGDADCQTRQQDFDALMEGHDVDKMLQDFARRRAEGTVSTQDTGLGIGSAGYQAPLTGTKWPPLGHTLEWGLTHPRIYPGGCPGNC